MSNPILDEQRVYTDLHWNRCTGKLEERHLSIFLDEQGNAMKAIIPAQEEGRHLGSMADTKQISAYIKMRRANLPFSFISKSLGWSRWTPIEESPWLISWEAASRATKGKREQALVVLREMNLRARSCVVEKLKEITSKLQDLSGVAFPELIQKYHMEQSGREDRLYYRKIELLAQKNLLGRVLNEIDMWLRSHHCDIPEELPSHTIESQPIDPAGLVHAIATLATETKALSTEVKSLAQAPRGKEERKSPRSILQRDRLADIYVQCCRLHKTGKPTLQLLSEISDVSLATWSKELSNPIFVALLANRINKAVNLCKNLEMRDVLASAFNNMLNSLDNLKTKRYESKTRSGATAREPEYADTNEDENEEF